MTILESRLATMADAAGILRAQNDTAASLQVNIPEFPTWTLDTVMGILDNMNLPRGNALMWVSDGIIGDAPLAGFLLCMRYRNVPPNPDPTEIDIQFVASRIEGTPIRDRLRLRRVFFGGMMALVRYCHTNGLTWVGRVKKSPPGVTPTLMENVIAEMAAEGYRVVIETIGGDEYYVIRSNDPVVDPATVRWPSS